MSETGEIIKQGRFGNQPESVARFLGPHSGEECSAVLEATRNWCVMHDWLEELTGQVTLAHPLKVKAIAEAKGKTHKIDDIKRERNQRPQSRGAEETRRVAVWRSSMIVIASLAGRDRLH